MRPFHSLFALSGFIAILAGSHVASAVAQTRPRESLMLDQVTVVGCSFPNFTFAGALAKAHELGFAGVEIAVFLEKETNYGETYPWVVVDQLSADEKIRLRAQVRNFRHVSTHLPYGPAMRPLAADPVIRAASRRELHRALDDSGFWGADVANIHVLSEPGVPYAAAKPELLKLYRELAEHAARLGFRLAIETSRPYRMTEYMDLIHSIDHPNVGGSIDTGHMVFYRPELGVEGAARQTPAGIRRYNDLIAEFVTGLGPKLYHVHIDDVRGIDWREHFVPGQGIIDWPRFFAHLARVNYRGLLAAELLYYDGADDRGPDVKAVFTRKTRDGAPAAGLRQMRAFLAEAMKASHAVPTRD